MGSHARSDPPASQAPSPKADAFLHYRTSKVRALRAAHLERLLWELVSGDREQDPSFVPTFLATHQAFVPTSQVLGLLLPPPPPPLPPWVEIKKTEEQGLSFNKNLRLVSHFPSGSSRGS